MAEGGAGERDGEVSSFGAAVTFPLVPVVTKLTAWRSNPFFVGLFAIATAVVGYLLWIYTRDRDLALTALMVAPGFLCVLVVLIVSLKVNQHRLVVGDDGLTEIRPFVPNKFLPYRAVLSADPMYVEEYTGISLDLADGERLVLLTSRADPMSPKDGRTRDVIVHMVRAHIDRSKRSAAVPQLPEQLLRGGRSPERWYEVLVETRGEAGQPYRELGLQQDDLWKLLRDPDVDPEVGSAEPRRRRKKRAYRMFPMHGASATPPTAGRCEIGEGQASTTRPCSILERAFPAVPQQLGSDTSSAEWWLSEPVLAPHPLMGRFPRQLSCSARTRSPYWCGPTCVA